MKLVFALLIVCGSVWAICPPTTVPYLDEFDLPTLESCWNSTNPDLAYQNSTDRPGWLRMYTLPGGTNCPGGTNNPCIVWRSRPTETAYVITTKLVFDPQEEYHEAGIRIWLTDLTELIYHRHVSVYDKIGLQVNLQSCGGATDPNWYDSLETDTTYLRLVIDGSSVKALHSPDGVDWIEDITYNDAWVSNPDLRIGLFAANGGFDGGPGGLDADTVAADFDFFHITSDEYILPVELLSFDARAEDGSVVLNWVTGSENGVSHFEIARDGLQVGSVAATNAATGNRYAWRDLGLQNGREYVYRLTSVDLDGTREDFGTVNATPRASEVPSEFVLLQNYPNPFNAATTIEFVLPDVSDISLTLHNLLGEEVAVLANGVMSTGVHRVNFDAAGLSSGIYFYRLQAGVMVMQKKMAVVR